MFNNPFHVARTMLMTLTIVSVIFLMPMRAVAFVPPSPMTLADDYDARLGIRWFPRRGIIQIVSGLYGSYAIVVYEFRM